MSEIADVSIRVTAPAAVEEQPAPSPRGVRVLGPAMPVPDGLPQDQAQATEMEADEFGVALAVHMASDFTIELMEFYSCHKISERVGCSGAVWACSCPRSACHDLPLSLRGQCGLMEAACGGLKAISQGSGLALGDGSPRGIQMPPGTCRPDRPPCTPVPICTLHEHCYDARPAGIADGRAGPVGRAQGLSLPAPTTDVKAYATRPGPPSKPWPGPRAGAPSTPPLTPHPSSPPPPAALHQAEQTALGLGAPV